MYNSVKESVLNEIINPLTIDDFLKSYWPKKPLVSNGDPNRFDVIPGFDKIKNLNDILEIYNNPVMVVGNAVIEESGGIMDRLLVPSNEALQWYEKGAALEFDFTDLFIPQSRRWVENLKSDLRLPEGTLSKVIVYAAKNGGGFKAHFDAYTNFIFQIKGEKIWKLYENHNVENPTLHYDLAEAPYYPEELKKYWTGEPPAEDLPDADVVKLTPGSMLYLPRGVWHSTKSDEETLAINITFGQPTWLDLLLSEMRSRLVSNSKWRELALNYNSLNNEEKNKVFKDIDNILSLLRKEVEKITPEDLLKHQSGDFDPYQSTQLVFRQLLTRY
jgi:50S ribosomal protein L16 3-hydroxylase